MFSRQFQKTVKIIVLGIVLHGNKCYSNAFSIRPHTSTKSPVFSSTKGGAINTQTRQLQRPPMERRRRAWVISASLQDEGDMDKKDESDDGESIGNHISNTIATATTLHGRLLCASQCAYVDTPNLRDNPYFMGAGYLPGTSVKRIQLRSGKDACLVGRTVDGIVVAFRGTNGSPLEWLQNASIFLRKVPPSYAPEGARVHEGFYGALSGRFGRGIKAAIHKLLDTEAIDDKDATLKKEIRQLLEENNETDDHDTPLQAAIQQLLDESDKSNDRDASQPLKIYLTGHSKGGSLASLFALALHQDQKLPSPELVCTFGAARVGNAAFGAYFESIINQVTYENDGDLVPFLPPGEETMEDIRNATENPEGMMDMIETILEPPNDPTRGVLFWRQRKNTNQGISQWKYNPIGKRTYIGPDRSLFGVTRDLDATRIANLEGANFRDLRRAHCSSCADESDDYDGDNDRGTTNNGNETDKKTASFCSGGYFEALAPEICERIAMV